MDYPYIRAWGALLHSFRYYVDGEVSMAALDKAPQNAIFKQDDGTWATVDEVTDAGTREWLHRWVKERGVLVATLNS